VASAREQAGCPPARGAEPGSGGIPPARGPSGALPAAVHAPAPPPAPQLGPALDISRPTLRVGTAAPGALRRPTVPRRAWDRGWVRGRTGGPSFSSQRSAWERHLRRSASSNGPTQSMGPRMGARADRRPLLSRPHAPRGTGRPRRSASSNGPTQSMGPRVGARADRRPPASRSHAPRGNGGPRRSASSYGPSQSMGPRMGARADRWPLLLAPSLPVGTASATLCVVLRSRAVAL
jgi:hypothetical protein